MMEKRNFITSVRTPSSEYEKNLEKDAESLDSLIEETVSEFTKKACENDEKSDRENPGTR